MINYIIKCAYAKKHDELLQYIKEIYALNGQSVSIGDDFYSNCEKLLEEDLFCESKIFILSFLMYITHDKKYTSQIIEVIKKSGLSYEEKYQLIYQIKSITFRYPELSSDFVNNYYLLKSIYDEAKDKLKKKYEYIPYENRDHNFVIILTSQFIGSDHGPTKHAIDHALALMNGMKKKVLLINTAEISSGDICTIFYCGMVSNYIDRYSDIDNIAWKGYSVPFFQCPNNMPDSGIIEVILDTIQKTRPEFVLEIGAGSLVAALAEQMVPVLTNGTMHAMIECSLTKYQTIARIPTEDELEKIASTGITEKNLIFSMFTSDVKEKSEIITRYKLRVPDDAFLVGLVGRRLNLEVNTELAEQMADSIKKNNNIYYIFFGGVEDFEKKFKKYDKIYDHFVNYGSTQDTISCLEQCDLYLNPDRIGGGMSAIEAMVVGIPAVSTSRGDGGVVLGKEFWIDSVNQYGEMVLEYSVNKELYEIKSNAAAKRGKYLNNSEEVFCDTIRDFLNRVKNDEC